MPPPGTEVGRSCGEGLPPLAASLGTTDRCRCDEAAEPSELGMPFRAGERIVEPECAPAAGAAATPARLGTAEAAAAR